MFLTWGRAVLKADRFFSPTTFHFLLMVFGGTPTLSLSTLPLSKLTMLSHRQFKVFLSKWRTPFRYKTKQNKTKAATCRLPCRSFGWGCERLIPSGHTSQVPVPSSPCAPPADCSHSFLSVMAPLRQCPLGTGSPQGCMRCPDPPCWPVLMLL